MSVRIVTHAVALPLPQIVRRPSRSNRRVQSLRTTGKSRRLERDKRSTKRTNPTVQTQLARMHVSGLSGVKHHQPVERWFARFEDDRDLTGLKVAIVGLVIVIVMLLEVPW